MEKEKEEEEEERKKPQRLNEDLARCCNHNRRSRRYIPVQQAQKVGGGIIPPKSVTTVWLKPGSDQRFEGIGFQMKKPVQVDSNDDLLNIGLLAMKGSEAVEETIVLIRSTGGFMPVPNGFILRNAAAVAQYVVLVADEEPPANRDKTSNDKTTGGPQ